VKEKEDLQRQLELEQEYVVNKLEKKLNELNLEKTKLGRYKVDLENQLEQEQEQIVNKLQKKLDKCLDEKRQLAREKNELQEKVGDLQEKVAKISTKVKRMGKGEARSGLNTGVGSSHPRHKASRWLLRGAVCLSLYKFVSSH
jgi:polyhydroxyalkanoate synthesis regulator phasin